jgi:hypothetical protein
MKKSVVTTQGPKKPKTSTLLLKGEMEIIQKIFDAYWEGLDDFNRNWKSFVREYTYSSLMKAVRNILNARYSLVDKYRRMTTLRLVEVRKAHNNPKLRKAQVTSEMLKETLFARQNPEVNYFAELTSVFGEETVKSVFPNPAELASYLVSDYSKEKIQAESKSFSAGTIKRITQAFNKVFRLDQLFLKVENLVSSMDKYKYLPLSKFNIWHSNLKAFLESLAGALKEVSDMTAKDFKIVLEFYKPETFSALNGAIEQFRRAEQSLKQSITELSKKVDNATLRKGAYPLVIDNT